MKLPKGSSSNAIKIRFAKTLIKALGRVLYVAALTRLPLREMSNVHSGRQTRGAEERRTHHLHKVLQRRGECVQSVSRYIKTSFAGCGYQSSLGSSTDNNIWGNEVFCGKLH